MARKKSKNSEWQQVKKEWRAFTKQVRHWSVVLLWCVLCVATAYYGIRWYVTGRVTGQGEYDGIDISKHNGKIDWEAVARDPNIKFVYIKATEGASVVDKRYEHNLREARAAGLKAGSYHFFRGYKTAEEQFALFSKTVKKSEQDLLPMVDVEEAGNRNVSRALLQERLEEFMRLVKKKYGKYPLLYSQYHFYNQRLAPEFNKYYIFIARYGNKEPELKGSGTYNIWQYTERGHIKGIHGTVDLDRLANGTRLSDIEL